MSPSGSKDTTHERRRRNPSEPSTSEHKDQESSPSTNPTTGTVNAEPNEPRTEQTTARIYEKHFKSNGERFGVKLTFPQHTEDSYRKEMTGEESAVLAMHRFFPSDRVPFKHKEVLGMGNFAVIDTVKPFDEEIVRANLYARKLFPVPQLQGRAKLALGHENTNIARSLSHPHILRVIFTYETMSAQGHMYGIIMSPVANCTLGHLLEKYCSSTIASDYLSQVTETWIGCLTSGMSYIHANGFVHGDIKLSSILIRDGVPFFTEFAISNSFDQSSTPIREGTSEMNSQSGIYRAPEVSLLKKPNFKSDIFSLGCVYMEVLSVTAGLSLDKIKEEVAHTSFRRYHEHHNETVKWITGLEAHLPSPFHRDFLPYCRAMLELDPSSRPSAFDLAGLVLTLLDKAHGGFAKLDRCECLSPWRGKKNDLCCKKVLQSMPHRPKRRDD